MLADLHDCVYYCCDNTAATQLLLCAHLRLSAAACLASAASASAASAALQLQRLLPL
jgi:hypothetical protein